MCCYRDWFKLYDFNYYFEHIKKWKHNIIIINSTVYFFFQILVQREMNYLIIIAFYMCTTIKIHAYSPQYVLFLLFRKYTYKNTNRKICINYLNLFCINYIICCNINMFF